MSNEEIIKAAAAIEFEMITLSSRLNEPFKTNVERCQNAAKEIKTEMENRGKNI